MNIYGKEHSMSINSELSKREFMQREHNITHSPYTKEMEFYACVRAGDTDGVKACYTPLATEGYGKLSKDPVRNMRYHLIVSVAMITRFCIEGGMEPEVAYTISDIYINKADECSDIKSLGAIHKEMIFDFTKRMGELTSVKVYSKQILDTLDYIYEHLHEKITVTEIAENIGLSPQYLSRLFHDEVGITISAYIMDKRVESAENMLKFSDYTPVDIGNYLNFSSHSHFIMVFKKHTGLTPREYREKFFRTNWGDSK